MGVVLGAAEYHGLPHPAHLFFGGSGHAFLLNADRSLSRSSVHNWSRLRFDALLSNLGMVHADLGHFGPDMTSPERNRLETGVRNLVSRGIPCSLKTIEHQLIKGFDERGFLLDVPPPLEGEVLPDRLDFGSWEQLRRDGSVSFHSFTITEQAPMEKIYRDSLSMTLESRSEPCGQPWQGCVQGNKAMDRWIACAGRPQGPRPPGGVLAIVLSECRSMAGHYLREAANLWPGVAQAAFSAARVCDRISLGFAGLVEPMPPDRLRNALKELKQSEKECLRELEKLLRAIVH